MPAMRAKTRSPAKRLRAFLLAPIRKDLHRLGERLDGIQPAAAAGEGAPAPLDINVQLHQARSAFLRQLPKKCEVFVSAGCAGLWYFKWVQRCYGDIGRHLGVEYYMPKPDGLPDNVVWIENTCSDMSAVGDKEADLVFSGENMEHLWPEEVCGFYKEAARILKPGGLLVIDSPNRAITRDLNWSHPEHTVELTVDEAIELTRLSGFDIEAVKGIWLCRDPATGKTLPFVPGPDDPISIVERNVMAVNDTENSFIWWIEARRNGQSVDVEALERRMNGIFAEAWPERLTRSMIGVGKLRQENGEVWAVAEDGDKGALIYGPYMPLKAGRYRVTFELDKPRHGGPAIATLDVVMREKTVTLASNELQVPPGRSTVTLEFELDQLEFGIQFRCLIHGGAGFACRKLCKLEVLGGPALDEGLASRPDSAGERPIAFMHVPKTAGTSIMAALREGLPPSAVIGGFDHAHFGEFRAFDEFAENIRSSIYAAPEDIPKGGAVIAGHMAWSTLRQAYPEARFMTILREPVCRLLSHWLFWRSQEDDALAAWGPWADRVRLARQPLQSFISNPIIASHTDNLAVRMLLGPHPLIPPGAFIRESDDSTLLAQAIERLATFDFVDCVENPALHERLETWLQRPLSYGARNETGAMPPARRAPLLQELTPAARQLLRDRSRLDLQLWQRVVKDAVPGLARKTAILGTLRRYQGIMTPAS